MSCKNFVNFGSVTPCRVDKAHSRLAYIRWMSNLIVVGKSSGVNKQTTENAPEIPNFPIMLNVNIIGINDTSPANSTVKHALTYERNMSHFHCVSKSIIYPSSHPFVPHLRRPQQIETCWNQQSVSDSIFIRCGCMLV